MWEVEYTDEFEDWWNTLNEEEWVDIDACVGLLEEYGPNLRHPFSSGINGSKHTHMRELRIQHARQPYRVLYAFDPRRVAILLPAKKQVMIVGTRNLCLLRISFTISILRLLKRRD